MAKVRNVLPYLLSLDASSGPNQLTERVLFFFFFQTPILARRRFDTSAKMATWGRVCMSLRRGFGRFTGFKRAGVRRAVGPGLLGSLVFGSGLAYYRYGSWAGPSHYTVHAAQEEKVGQHISQTICGFSLTKQPRWVYFLGTLAVRLHLLIQYLTLLDAAPWPELPDQVPGMVPWHQYRQEQA